MSPILSSLFTFLAVILAVVGAYSLISDLFIRDRERVQQRIKEQFQIGQRERAKQSLLVKDFEVVGADGESAASAPPSMWNLRGRIQIMLDQSGLPFGMGRL